MLKQATRSTIIKGTKVASCQNKTNHNALHIRGRSINKVLTNGNRGAISHFVNRVNESQYLMKTHARPFYSWKGRKSRTPTKQNFGCDEPLNLAWERAAWAFAEDDSSDATSIERMLPGKKKNYQVDEGRKRAIGIMEKSKKQR